MSPEEIKKLSREELFSEETMIEIFQLEDEFDQAATISAAEERATELKAKTEFKRLFLAFKKKFRRMLQESGKIFEYGGKKFDLGNWMINRNGVMQFSERGDIYACYHPILPVKRLKNIENKTEKKIHVRSVKLNGQPILDNILSHKQIISGGTLEFKMK